ncbi:MAG: hypothetical protein ABI744_05935 [Chloroflexota bacterium]
MNQWKSTARTEMLRRPPDNAVQCVSGDALGSALVSWRDAATAQLKGGSSVGIIGLIVVIILVILLLRLL